MRKAGGERERRKKEEKRKKGCTGGDYIRRLGEVERMGRRLGREQKKEKRKGMNIKGDRGRRGEGA